MNRSLQEWDAMETLLDELVEDQKRKLLLLGRKIVPSLTPEDVMQPNDYPKLDNDPVFRYEEGMLAGMLSTQMAIRALRKDRGLA